MCLTLLAFGSTRAPCESTATLWGVVRGPDGSPLPGAAVTLTPASGRPLLTASGERGVFRIAGLEPGAWELAAESPGFSPVRMALAPLAPGESREVAIALQIATLRETVVVVGSAPGDALEAASIRESAARDVGEALGASVGVWKLRKGGIASDVVVRGLGQRDVNVLVDGQRVMGACPNRMDPAAFHVDLAEVERVEVAKGPFDVRHQGSLGGLVNVVTRRPAEGLHVEPALSMGAFGFVNPALTASWADERGSVLAGYSYRTSEPFRDGDGRRFTEATNYRPETVDADAFRVGTGWLRLGWRPGDGHDVQVAWTRQRADGVLYPYLRMDAVYDDTDRLNLLYEANGLAGGASALSVRVSHAVVDHWMTDELRSSSSGAPRGWSMGTQAQTRTSEARIEVRLGGATLGVEAGRRSWDATTQMAGMGYRSQATIPDVQTDVVGAFAEASRELGPGLSFTAGARLDHVRAEADAEIANVELYAAYHGTRATRVSHTLPSGKLRLSWAGRPGLELAATLGHTARVGEANELFLALRRAGHDWVGFPELSPARSTGLDVSARWERAGTVVSGSVYVSHVVDFVDVVARPPLAVAPEGAASARSWANVDATLRGAEALAVVPVARHLFASGDVSWTRGTRRLDATAGVTDADMAEIPPLRGRLSLRYDDGRFLAALEGVFSGRQDHVDASLDETPTPGWGIANLRLGYRSGRLSVVAGATNLFDRAYAEHVSYQRDPFRSGARVAEPGRAAFVNLSARF